MRRTKVKFLMPIFALVKKTSAYLGLALILLLTTAFGYQMKNLKFSDNFDAFFPEGDTALDYYSSITDEFGVFNDFLFISLEGDDVYSADFLTKVDSLTKILEDLDETESILSPTNFKKFQVTPFGLNSFNVLNPSKGIESKTVRDDPQLYGQFFGKNDQSIGMILRHQAFDNKQLADDFYLELISVFKTTGFASPIISGKIQAQYDFSIRLKNEISLLLTAAIFLIIIMLSLIFRTVRGVIIPLITLFITLIWIFGFFSLTGRPIDVLAIMIPPILLVVSMSDVIHLCDKFNESLQRGLSIIEAIKESIRLVGLATLLTSLTTAIGFFSLAISPIHPIKNFGIYTGIGVLFAFIVTFTTIPCLLLILNKPLSSKNRTRSLYKTQLTRLHLWVISRRKVILLISLITLIASAIATFNVKRNTFLIVGVDKSDPLMESMNYFDQHFDGNKPFEMTYILANDQDLFSKKTLQNIEAIQTYLETEYGISHIESPITLIKSINQAISGGAKSGYVIPDERDFNRIKRIYNSRQLAELKSHLHSKDGLTLRINGRGKDIGSAEASKKNKAFTAFIEGPLNLSKNEYEITGTSYLIDKTDTYIVSSIVSGLCIAILAVALLMLAISRSVYVMLISILPNLLPLLLLSGIMGVFGIDLNIATAVIFSIAFGIAVDDSIHFITRYELERKDNPAEDPIQRAMISTGKSIILTTYVLFVGFIVFLFSGFSATFYIGFFVATTLVVALVADLTLLPALLSFKKK